jgi:serine/threonine protein kinase
LKKPKSKYSYLPPVIAVKSAEVSVSCSIQKEREVLNNVKGCANVIRCFGEETTRGDNGEMAYNLLLEYGSGGTLADLIKKNCKGLGESQVRCYTRSILRGINHIHDCGYVHNDLKPDNILLLPNKNKTASTEFRAKIGDLGLAKRAKQSKKIKIDPYWRGTPMYLSPEAVIDGVQEPRSDIWAVGCIVLEMLTGNPPWEASDSEEILNKISEGNNLPKIPSWLSKEAKNFLKGCFVKKVVYRLTAEMLLAEPFVAGIADDDNDDDVNEFAEVADVNAVSSCVLSDTDDDDDDDSFSMSWSFSNDEDDLYSCWSDEEIEVSSSFAEEDDILKNNIDAVKGSSKVPSSVPQQYSIAFSVPAGI